MYRAAFSLDCLLDGDLFSKTSQRVVPLQLINFWRCVLVQKFINREVAASNSDVDFVFFDFDGYSFGAKLVDALGFAHKHYLELGPLRIIVDKLSELLVDLVIFDRDVDGDPMLQVVHILFEGVYFHLGVLELFEKIQRRLIGLVYFFLELQNIIGRIFVILLQGSAALLVFLETFCGLA